MENESCFDLESAVGRWRQSLENSPALRGLDVQELEAHLRDSVAALQTRGLSAEEAFLIASQRLGQSRQLGQEFSKANPQRVWLDRLLWFLAGIVLLDWILWLSGLVSSIVTNRLMSEGLSPNWIGALTMAANAIVQVSAMVAVWRLLRHIGTKPAHWISDCIRRPWAPIVALLMINYYRPSLSNWFLQMIRPAFDTVPAPPSQVEWENTMMAWNTWRYVVTVLLFTAAFFYLLRCRVRLWAPELRVTAERDREGDARESTSAMIALQQQGLSCAEARFLLQRRSVAFVAGASPECRSDSDVWLHRGLWMLMGTQASQYLFVPLSMIVQVLALGLIGWLDFRGQLAGALAFAFESTVLAVLAIIAWTSVNRRAAINSQAERWLTRRPAITSIVLIASGLASYSLPILIGWAYGPAISSLSATIGPAHGNGAGKDTITCGEILFQSRCYSGRRINSTNNRKPQL